MNYVADLPCRREKLKNIRKFKPMNSTHMEVMFKLPPGSENTLNGTYSIHHESCPGSVCGGGDFKTPEAEEDVADDPFFGHGYSERHSSLRSYGGYGDQLIHIATGLSPCLDHQNITVKVYTKGGGSKKSKAMSYKKLSLKEIQLCNSCDETSRLSEDLATDKWCQSATTRSRSGGGVERCDGSHVNFPGHNSCSDSASQKTSDETLDQVTAFFVENNYQNTIIVGSAFVVLVLAIVITCCLVRRRRRNRSYDLTN